MALLALLLIALAWLSIGYSLFFLIVRVGREELTRRAAFVTAFVYMLCGPVPLLVIALAYAKESFRS